MKSLHIHSSQNSFTNGIYHGRPNDIKVSSFSTFADLGLAMVTRALQDLDLLKMSEQGRLTKLFDILADRDFVLSCAMEAYYEEQRSFEGMKDIHGEDFFKTYETDFIDEDEILFSDRAWDRLKRVFGLPKKNERMELSAAGDEARGFELWKIETDFDKDTLSHATRILTNAIKWRI